MFWTNKNTFKFLEDLISKVLALTSTVLENKADGIYDKYLDRNVKLLKEDISSKKYMIKNIYQINSFFNKKSYNQNNKQSLNAEIQESFVFSKSKTQ